MHRNNRLRSVSKLPIHQHSSGKLILYPNLELFLEIVDEFIDNVNCRNHWNSDEHFGHFIARKKTQRGILLIFGFKSHSVNENSTLIENKHLTSKKVYIKSL